MRRLPENFYIETAKECPKCHEMSLFLCMVIEIVAEHKFVGHLGVKCRKCNYEATLKQV